MVSYPALARLWPAREVEVSRVAKAEIRVVIISETKISKTLCSLLEARFPNACTKFWWPMARNFEDISWIVRLVDWQGRAPYSTNHVVSCPDRFFLFVWGRRKKGLVDLQYILCAAGSIWGSLISGDE